MWFDLDPEAPPRRRAARGVEWALRWACALCFIGHGAWGVITKAGWLPFFAVFGIPEPIAWKLMPVVGTFDIVMGFSILIRPTRAVLAWMALWATFTAFLRPMAGYSGYEVIERAGNFGPPMLLLMWASAGERPSGWLQRIELPALDPALVRKLVAGSVVSLSLLLIGHGGFGAHLVKPSLLPHWAPVGLGPTVITAENWLRLTGCIEITLGLMLLLSPWRPLLVWVLGWKLFTELLYPVAGLGIFEFIERAGDYFLPLALYQLDAWRKAAPPEDADRDDAAPSC